MVVCCAWWVAVLSVVDVLSFIVCRLCVVGRGSFYSDIIGLFNLDLKTLSNLKNLSCGIANYFAMFFCALTSLLSATLSIVAFRETLLFVYKDFH